MTTICISVPALKTITLGLCSDWGPTLHAAARRLGAVVALIWTLWSMAADRWKQLVAWAQEHQLHGLARLGLHGGNYPESPDSSTAEESSVVPATIVQRQPGGNLKASLTGSAPDHFPGATEMVTTPVGPKPVATTNGAELSPAPEAAPVTTPANLAPPSIRRLAAEGLSQRKIAGTLGLTRYQVQKALAA